MKFEKCLLWALLLLCAACQRKTAPLPTSPDAAPVAAIPAPLPAPAAEIPATPDPQPALMARLRRTGCYGSCPAFEALIYADGTAIWRGERNVLLIGQYEARIPRQWLVELGREALRSGFFELPAQYPVSGKRLDGLPTTTTFVRIDGRPSHEVINHVDAPPALLAFERFFQDHLLMLEWQETGQ
jgi:Domain of unknown function (DUF6438)